MNTFADIRGGDAVLHEAYCARDDQTYNPTGDELAYEQDGDVYVEHYGYEDETGWHECGRFGLLVGSWS